jgi:xanthine/uracil permease
MRNRKIIALALKALAVWCGILLLAIANGVLREAALVPLLGKTAGLIASGISLSALIIAVAYFSMPWFGRHSLIVFVGIGLGWLALTLLFETSFARFQGKSWMDILDAYRFQGGNIWPLVLLVTGVAPCLAAKIRSWT